MFLLNAKEMLENIKGKRITDVKFTTEYGRNIAVIVLENGVFVIAPFYDEQEAMETYCCGSVDPSESC